MELVRALGLFALKTPSTRGLWKNSQEQGSHSIQPRVQGASCSLKGSCQLWGSPGGFCSRDYRISSRIWTRESHGLMEWNCSSPFMGRGASLVAQLVKNLLAMQETWGQSLGWEDPLEKEMATLSSILAWKSMARGAGELQSMGSQRDRHDQETDTFTVIYGVTFSLPRLIPTWSSHALASSLAGFPACWDGHWPI